MAPAPSKLYKRWSFRKANWELYGLTTNQLSQKLSSPGSSPIDEAYQIFEILPLQQQNYQFHTVAETTIDRVGIITTTVDQNDT